MGLRHWKQRYAFDADLIFSRTMKLGICGVAIVHPGDPVTEEMKTILGRNRLKLWWESKRVELADFDGDLGRVLSRDERADREQLRQRIAIAKAEQEQLDADHNIGGPSVDPLETISGDQSLLEQVDDSEGDVDEPEQDVDEVPDELGEVPPESPF